LCIWRSFSITEDTFVARIVIFFDRPTENLSLPLSGSLSFVFPSPLPSNRTLRLVLVSRENEFYTSQMCDPPPPLLKVFDGDVNSSSPRSILNPGSVKWQEVWVSPSLARSLTSIYAYLPRFSLYSIGRVDAEPQIPPPPPPPPMFFQCDHRLQFSPFFPRCSDVLLASEHRLLHIALT